MTIIIALIAAAVVIAIVAVIALALRGASSGELAAQQAPETGGLRPPVADFHVQGDTATVFYDVPLPPGEIDDHLRDLLLQDAARVVGEKEAAGLPIDQVVRVRANGLRDGEPVEAGVLDLREPGALPDLAAPDLVPHATTMGYDPLAHIGEQDFEVPGIAASRAEEGLEPFNADLEVTGRVETSLRASGIDPSAAALEDLTLGLLAMGGYTVVPLSGGPSGASQYMATAGGEDTLVAVLPHHRGEHPELSEQTVDTFVFGVAERNPTRAMLVTDKFGPYAIYDRERRNPKCRFITRERLQAFVDGFALQS